MSGKVILTADSTLMSDYRHNEFLGFGTCAPPNFIPDWFYRWLFFPPIREKDGVPSASPYGLRKIEAQLLGEGFDVRTVTPNRIKKYLPEANVLGIHVMDPFGIGPASSTLATVLKKEPFLAQYFRKLLGLPEIREAKRRGLKIIVGGPGAWQFRYRQNFVDKYGIDCVIEGEAEKAVGKIFKAAVEGESVPRLFEVGIDETPSLDEIPDIVGPSVNGLVEIGRGCCRGCKFCSVTLRPLRWYPIEKIMREIDVNLGADVRMCCLHMEDVMLYGSRNTIPNEQKLIELNEMAAKKADSLSWSHCSLAAVALKPRLLSKVSEIILQKQAWWGAEIGIETGSPELAEKIMPAKAHPFKPAEWPEVVRTGMGLMHDNKLVPACTLIVGSPEETESDLGKTLDLLDDIRDARSLIVPLFFVPMGRLKDERWFEEAQMTDLHHEVLVKCLEHDLHWIDDLVDWVFAAKWHGRLWKPFYRLFTSVVRYKIRTSNINVKDG